MLKLVKIILAKNIWSVVAIWSILVLIFLAITWHQYLLFYLQTCHFYFYLPATPHKHNSGLNSNSRCRAAAFVTRPAAAAQEAKEGLTPAAGEETEACAGAMGPSPDGCVRAGAALIASDWEGFDACGEEDCGECPARDGDDAGTGGSRRVAAPRPHRQQLRGLDATAIIHNLRTVTPRYGELLALLVYLTLRYVDYEC